MQRVMRATGLALGLAVLGTIIGTGESARAAGVRISGGGIEQFGEPYYFYVTELIWSLDSRSRLVIRSRCICSEESRHQGPPLRLQAAHLIRAALGARSLPISQAGHCLITRHR